MRISFLLLTSSCSNDDESTLAPDLDVKEIAVIETPSIDSKSANVGLEKIE